MITIHQTRIYSGYSRYGDPPVARVSLTIALQDADPDAVTDALTRMGLAIHSEAVETNRAMPWVVTAFAALVLDLLGRADHETRGAVVEQSDHNHVIDVTFGCEVPESCIRVAEIACELINAASRLDDTRRLAPLLGDCLTFAREVALDPDARLVMRAARDRGLPVIQLDLPPFGPAPMDRPIRFGLYQIGHGSQARVLLGAMPTRDAQQKLLQVDNRSLLMPALAAAAIPLPDQDFEFPNKTIASRAVRAAARLTGPVMVKSIVKEQFRYRQRAIKVYGPLGRPEQITLAFEAAAGTARNVWIEAHVPGDRYRFLVIGGRVRAVARCRPPSVTGDGCATVANLIGEQVRRAMTPRQRRAWAELGVGDTDVDLRLRLAGLGRDAVVPAGLTVELRAEGTPYNGGTCEDATDTLSDAIRELAERAAACSGLFELAGVDMVLQDPRREARKPNCVVVDVLPDPDLTSHGELGSALARALVDTLVPQGRSARIPLVAVTGTNGKTTTTRMTAHILRHVYAHVGVTTTEGAYVDDDRLRDGDMSGVPGVLPVLADRRTDAAVLETARGGLITVGIGFDRCNVGLLLNVSSDHLGVDGIHTVEQMAHVKAEVLRRADDAVIVNAEDPLCLAMLQHAHATRHILVARELTDTTLVVHRDGGGEIVATDWLDGVCWIVHVRGALRVPVMPVNDIPATLNGILHFNVMNALCACAAALALPVPIDTSVIRNALSSFTCSHAHNPGRYNFIEGFPFTVLLDFAHNPPGVRELLRVVRTLAPSGKTHLVCLTIGPRHKAHIDMLAAPFAETFDTFVLGCNPENVRKNPEYSGEAPEQTMLDHFEARLLACGVLPSVILVSRDPEKAIRAGLERGKAGDLVVVLALPDVALPVLLERLRPSAVH